MQSEDVRTRLLETAGSIFAEKGYQASTVREICARAGLNAASVNYYFGDKETLYLEAVKLARQLRAERFPMPQHAAGTAPEVRLRDFVKTMTFRMVDDQDVGWNTKLMMREVLNPTHACRTLVHDYFRPHFEMLMGILQAMLPETTPAHVIRMIGFSIVGQCVYYRVAGEVVTLLTPENELREHFTREQIADHITRMCLAAIKSGLMGSEQGIPSAHCEGHPDDGG